MKLTFITGNQGKADQLSEWLGYPIDHLKLDLDELQSVDLKAVVKHKALGAYAKIKTPVLVEDVEIRCLAMGGLPGPFIKWFIKDDIELSCKMLDAFDDRRAVARVMYALNDGHTIHYFEGETEGSIAKVPKGTGGFGWDAIFIPKGYAQTRAEMTQADYQATSPRAKAILHLKDFLDREKT